MAERNLCLMLSPSLSCMKKKLMKENHLRDKSLSDIFEKFIRTKTASINNNIITY